MFPPLPRRMKPHDEIPKVGPTKDGHIISPLPPKSGKILMPESSTFHSDLSISGSTEHQFTFPPSDIPIIHMMDSSTQHGDMIMMKPKIINKSTGEKGTYLMDVKKKARIIAEPSDVTKSLPFHGHALWEGYRSSTMIPELDFTVTSEASSSSHGSAIDFTYPTDLPPEVYQIDNLFMFF